MAGSSTLSEVREHASAWNSAATGAAVAAAAALAWIALGIESIVRPEQKNYRDALWFVPFALTAASFVFMHMAQRSRGGRLEVASFCAVMIASALVFLGNVGVVAGQSLLSKLGFPWGAILWMTGMIAFGVGTLTAGKLPRYVGIAVILFEPGSLLTGLALSPIAPLHERGAYSAGIEKGIVLALVAMGLRALNGRQSIN